VISTSIALMPMKGATIPPMPCFARAATAYSRELPQPKFAHVEETFLDMGRALPFAFREQGGKLRIAVMLLKRHGERTVDRHEQLRMVVGNFLKNWAAC